MWITENMCLLITFKKSLYPISMIEFNFNVHNDDGLFGLGAY